MLATPLEIRRSALLVRKSRGDADTDLDRHEARLREVAAQKGLVVDRVFREIVSGGAEVEDREALRDLLAYVDTERPYAVQIVDMERLARDGAIALDVFKFFRKRGVRLIVGDSEKDLNERGTKTLTAIQAILGEDELDSHKRRLFSGRLDTAKAGGWPSGKAPYGYIFDRNERALKIDQTTKEAVAFIFSEGLRGTPLNRISDELNLRQIAPPSAGTKKANQVGWSRQSVRNILTNATYAGKISFNKSSTLDKFDFVRLSDEWVFTDGNHEPYIDYPAWLKLQDKLTHAPRDASKRTIFALSALVVCPHCGRKQALQNPHGKRIHVKPCQAPACGRTVGVPEEVLLAAIVGKAQEYVEQLKTQVSPQVSEPTQEVSAGLMKSIEKLKAEKSRVIQSFRKGWTTEEEADKEIKQIDTELRTLTKRLDSLQREEIQAGPSIEERTAKMQEAITALVTQTMESKTQNSVLKAIVRSVSYIRDGSSLQVSITWQ